MISKNDEFCHFEKVLVGEVQVAVVVRFRRCSIRPLIDDEQMYEEIRQNARFKQGRFTNRPYRDQELGSFPIDLRKLLVR